MTTGAPIAPVDKGSLTAGAGDIVDIIAASAAAGTKNLVPNGIRCQNGVYADFAGPGTVTFFYQQG